MTKKILDKNYILSKYDIIKTNKHRLPVSLDFTKAENDFIRTNFQSIEKLYVYFGDQPTHGNVWIPDDIYITEIQQLAQELGYPPTLSIIHDQLRLFIVLKEIGKEFFK
ncbi:hypothetical protein [Lactobacillus crispatus]|uniref:hypothetical protein n=1 Tax=Lactobacillus crispatus TaxID=47770 RepID=UPI00106218BB|nr:hypothetical protein [Lactobacillus crispatus]TDN00963.1 hypothetical protein CEE85_13090 [Lactobacillus crispatus]